MSTLSVIEYSLGLSFYFYFKIITLERYVFTRRNKTFETNTAKPFLPHVHKRLESTRSMRPSCAACRGKKKGKENFLDLPIDLPIFYNYGAPPHSRPSATKYFGYNLARMRIRLNMFIVLQTDISMTSSWKFT